MTKRDFTPNPEVDLMALSDGFEYSPIEAATLPRVLSEGCAFKAVLVGPILTVEQLGAHHDWGATIEHPQLHLAQRKMPMLEADESCGDDLDAFARWGPPNERAAMDPGSEVDHPFVMFEVGRVDPNRLIIDVELHYFGVGNIYQRLPNPSECMGGLGMFDFPRLVKSVHEGSVAVRYTPLGWVVAHAEVAVSDGKQGFSGSEVASAWLEVDQSPWIDRKAERIEKRDVSLHR